MHRQTLTTDPWPHDLTAAPERKGNALAQIGGALRRSWVWVAVPTLAVVIGAVAFVQVATPSYTGEAKVVLESRDSSAGSAAEPTGEQAAASQVQLAMTRDLARAAIRRLKLLGNAEFDPNGGEIGPLERVLTLLGLSKSTMTDAPEDRLLGTFLDHVRVEAADEARTVAIGFHATDAALAAEGANTVAELVIGALASAQVDATRQPTTLLSANVDSLSTRVAEAEAKVEAFRAKNGLIGSGGAANLPLSGQQLSELSSQLSQARTIKADLTARAKMLKEMIKDGRAFEIPDVANNELFRRTIESRMSLRAQLALESRTLLPAHPRIKELTAQVTDLENQIKATAERIVRTLDNDAKIAGARVESLQAAVDGQSDVVAKGNGSEIQLRALEREAKALREQLESYVSRHRDAATRDAGAVSPADARIVSRATTPETPFFPQALPTVGWAAALAFLLSAGAVAVRHRPARLQAPTQRYSETRAEPALDAALHDEDMARFSADPERLAYPEAEPLEPRIVAPTFVAPEPTADDHAEPQPEWMADAPPANDARPLDESDRRVVPAAPVSLPQRYELDALVARLSAGARDEGRCVLVVEPMADDEEGLALSLAAHLANRFRALVIDVNGRTGRGADAGLSDLVAGEASFSDVIHAVGGSRLHAIGRGVAGTDILVEEPQGLAIGLNALSQAYDWTICRLDLDGPDAHALLPTLSANATSVVIASEARADDAELATLHDLAMEAGAGEVLVARVRDAAWQAHAPEPEMELRLCA